MAAGLSISIDLYNLTPLAAKTRLPLRGRRRRGRARVPAKALEIPVGEMAHRSCPPRRSSCARRQTTDRWYRRSAARSGGGTETSMSRSSNVVKGRSRGAGFIAALAFAFTSTTAGRAATPPPFHARHAAVASANAEASAAGLSLLKGGGNAIAAACATALALGVVHPFASGIGGGGFALVDIAKQHRTYAFDFRERAPADIRADMFLKDGKADPRLSREGGLAVGVPGEVRGLGELVRRFGKLPFDRCVAPAERLTRQAHVSWRLAEVAADKPPIPGVPAARDPIVPQLFGKQALAAGEVFRR